jgi:hypothetical protein
LTHDPDLFRRGTTPLHLHQPAILQMASMRVITEFIDQIRFLFYPHLAAGRNAELAFEQLAHEQGWVVEKIPQDRDGFSKYAAASARGIKRGDYIVRNLRNTEIEVKCFSLSRGANPGYLLRYSHVKRHEGMQDMTESAVVFAIFERRGRHPVPGSLRMIPLSELTRGRSREIAYVERLKSLHIPLSSMYPGFGLLERMRAATRGRDGSMRW